MLKSLILLIVLLIIAGCQAKGGGTPGGGIISGHVPVDNKFTLSTPLNVTYISAQTIPFTLTFPLDVTVTGSPKLTVTIGSTVVDADFVSVTGNELLFEYDVQVGDSDLNGIAVASSLNLNGATLTFNEGENCNTTIALPSLTSVKVSAVSGSAPVSNNISPANFNEDTSSTITLNYIDADGDQATSCAISSPTKVTVTTPCACAAGVCTVGVTGAANQNGPAGFGFTVTSLGQTSNTAAATFTLNPVADVPVANSFVHPAFNEDAISTITLSYTDADGDLGATCSTSALSNVTVTTPCGCSAGVCTVSVRGTSNYSGAASLSYTVTANSQVSNTAIVSMTINSLADAPVTTVQTPPAFSEDTQSIITLPYTDAESDLATACSVTLETNVTETQLCACAAGVCTVGVTGTSNYFGAGGQFTYTVTANGQTSNASTTTFTINAVDDKPVGNVLTPPSFPENTESIITLTYTDVESHLATTCSVTGETNITESQLCACAAGTCTVGVTGTLNHVGSASFNYTVTANGLTSDVKAANLTITNQDVAPVATNLTPGPFAEDSVNTITLNYSDADSDLATTCSVTGETNLTESTLCSCAAGTCTVGITGGTNYNGAAATFNYTVTANGLTSNSATATITYTTVDDMPVGTTTTAANFSKNTQSIITLAYTDVESHSATTCGISFPVNVSVTQACACVAGTCTVGVTGDLNYTGAASFDYKVTTNGLDSNDETVTFTILNTDTAPVATNMTPGPFAEDSVNIITLSYSDVDSDQATACSVTGETNVTESTLCSCTAGTCTVGITGAANYFGAAGTFSYTVTANGLTSNSATATITYTAVDDKPVATTTTAPNFDKNTQSIITLAYTDVETDQATVCAVSSLSNVTETQPCACAAGTCTVGVTGTSNYFGAAGLSYTVTANGLTSDVQAVSFTIDNIDTAPVATNINPGPFAEDSVQTVTLSYSDADLDQATACSVTGETNLTESTLCSCSAGLCTVGITGAADYFGATGSFSFTVTANGQVSNTATATITYSAVDDAPVTAGFVAPSFAKNAQSIITLPYTDVESDSAASCSVTLESNVSETQACTCSAGTCTVGVTGTSNYTGAGNFTYTVTANTLESNASIVTFTITNTPPVANGVTPAAFNEDVQSIITLDYTDVDSDQATTCSISGESNVTVSQGCSCSAGTCTVGVTGTQNTNGAASFNYTVTAGGQASNSAAATLSITPVDDKPTGVPLTPPAFDEDTESTITLTYSDVEGDSAASCTATGLSNVTVTTPCSCTLGTCTVGVTGTSNYSGVASFDYTVTANGLTSDSQPVSLTITGLNDAPTTANLTPPAFNEDIQSVITLTNTPVGGDLATNCAVTSPVNVTVTQPCACVTGTCTVGVTGTANYNGSASFQWTVSAGTAQSTSRNAALTINSIDDAASLSAIGAQLTTPNTATGAIAFTFNDPDGSVCTSARLSMTSTNTTLVPNANVVWGGTAPNCTATITPAANQTGTSTITFTATDGGLSSKTTFFTLSVTGALLRWEEPPINTIITSYSFGTPGGNTSVTLKVKNYGNAAATPVISSDNGSSKITTLSTCGSVSAGGTCDIVVDWTNNGSPGYRQTIFTATGPSNAASVTVSGTR